jgi:hypothetical protein
MRWLQISEDKLGGQGKKNLQWDEKMVGFGVA